MIKILIADDDKGYREILREIFEDNGHTVIEAEDGEIAIAMYRKNADIDFVITDYSMPKKDGLAVVREIRRTRPQARIWLVSNAMDDEIKSWAIEAGAEQSISKMDTKSELRQWGIIDLAK